MWRMSSSRALAVAVTLAVLASAIAVVFLAAPARAATTYPSALMIESGSQAGESFGRSVAIVDINHDGVADLAVGAPYATAGSLGQTGAVFLYLSGPDGSGGTKPFASVYQLNGTHAGDAFGWSLAAVGDVNGDGAPDLAIGGPLASPKVGANILTDAGNVTILEGGKPFNPEMIVSLNGTAADDEFGYSIAAGGDVNGGGISDFLVGAPYRDAGTTLDVGAAFVFYGSATLSSSTAPVFTFTGTTAGGHMGWSIAGGVNVDKDASLDMVVGAPDQGAAGSVYIIRNINAVSPGPAINIVGGKASGDKFGTAVTMLPDINGDGFGDIAVGAPFNADGGAGAGEVSVIYGGTKFNTVVDLTLMGQPGEEFGYALAAGDIREDGFSDLLVGAPASSLNVTSGGRAYAFFGGAAPSTTANLTLVPATADGPGLFGSAVTTGGNFTAGHDFDFAVGSPLATVSSTFNVGRAYVYSGTKVPTIKAPTVDGIVCIPFTDPCQGLANFVVSLQNAGLTKTFTTTATGVFNLSSVPAGTYYLNATSGGYVENSTVVTLAVNIGYHFLIEPFTIPKVAGLIKDKSNNTFVNGVTVRMYNGTTLVNSTTNGPSGLFSMYVPIAYIPALKHTVNVTLAFFDATHYTNTTGVIELARNQTATFGPLSHNTLYLDRFPFVSGTVRDGSTLGTIRGATIQVTQGTQVLATATTNNLGAYSLWAVNATVPAPAFFNVTATGYARVSTQLAVDMNQAYTDNFLLFADRTAPTSSLNALTAYTTTAVFSVSGTDADPGDGVAQVQLYYKFNNTGSFVLAGSLANPGPTFSFSFNSTAARGDGYYQFYSLATDYAANVQATPATNMTWTLVDTMAPVSSLAAIPAYETAANFTLSATAYDWNGIHNVTLWYRKGTSGAFHYAANDSTSPYAFWFNVTLLGTGDGLYQFYSVGVDKAGNVEAAPATPDAMTIVDTTPASLTITAPTSGQVVPTGYVNVTWTASDTTSGISHFDAKLDSGAWVHAGANLYYNFTGVADGAHAVTVNATDNAGNSKLATVSFTVSTSEPTVAISSPASGAIVASSSVAIAWSVSNVGAGLSAVEVRLDTGAWTSVGVSATTYTFTGVSDGAHTLGVRATGINGAQGTASVSVTVDATAPTLDITQPTNNAYLAASSVTVAWTASDAASGLASVAISVDGGTYTAVSGTSTTLTGLADGSHTISLKATDNAGNSATASVTVVVDTTNPTVSVSSPAAGAWVNTSSVTITFAAADAGSGVASLTISVDGGTPVTVTGTTYTATLADGSHTVVLTATDKAGNIAQATRTFKVDTSKPSVSISQPAAGATLSSSTVTVTWTQDDTGSGVADVQISVDGGAYRDLGTATTETLTGLSDGSHTVSLKVKDVAGNVQTSSVTFTVSTASTGGLALEPLLIGGVVVVIVVVAVVAAMLMRRRGGKGPSEKAPGETKEETPPPPPPGE